MTMIMATLMPLSILHHNSLNDISNIFAGVQGRFQIIKYSMPSYNINRIGFFTEQICKLVFVEGVAFVFDIVDFNDFVVDDFTGFNMYKFVHQILQVNNGFCKQLDEFKSYRFDVFDVVNQKKIRGFFNVVYNIIKLFDNQVDI